MFTPKHSSFCAVPSVDPHVPLLSGQDTEDAASQSSGGSRTKLPSDLLTVSGDGAQATRISSKDQAKMGVESTIGQVKIQDKTSLFKGGVATAESVSSLASFFTSGQKSAESVESVVLHSVGMERLTRLGRVTSVRVTVEKLQLAPMGIEVVKSQEKNKKLSRAAGYATLDGILVYLIVSLRQHDILCGV